MHSQKILIFINSLTSGGAERVTVSLAHYLVRQGYAVTLVTMHGTERDFFELNEQVKRISLELAGEFRGLGRITANIRRATALRRMVKKESPDVVLGMQTTCAVLSILACLGLSIRVVVSERNFPDRKEARRQWAMLRRMFYRLAHGHAAQTREAAEWLRKHTRAKNIHVVPNPVSWPLPECNPVLDPEELLGRDDKLVLAAGSLSRQKGFDLLIQAFAAACQDHPEWKLLILGEDGDKEGGAGQRRVLEELVQDKGLAGRVLMPGRAGNMGDWYERADLYVLSSRYEGFPNVLLEAMAAGCACISFDCDTGPRDIIRQGVDGVLVSAEDVQALAGEMHRLMGNAEGRRKLGVRAVEVRERFSPEEIFGLWVEVLEG